MKKSHLWIVAIATIHLPISASAEMVRLHDSFEKISEHWEVDSYKPAGFTSVEFEDERRLEISVEAGPQKQGMKHPAVFKRPWIAYGSLYIEPWMLDSKTPFRTDLRLRTEVIKSEEYARYPFFGLIRSSRLITNWLVWDPRAPGEQLILDTPVKVGRNILKIKRTRHGYDYIIDDKVIHRVRTGELPAELTDIFLDVYSSGSDYKLHWDDVGVVTYEQELPWYRSWLVGKVPEEPKPPRSTVPDGSVTFLLLGSVIAFLALVARKFRP